jgi:MarR family transcriptional regulator, organic hydroperoxide resistance regulator
VFWEQDGQTGPQLGARLVIDSATMTGVVDRLERSGLVERRADIDDRSIYHLFATCRGRSLRPQLDSAMAKLNDEVAGLLGQSAPRFHRMLCTVKNEPLPIPDEGISDGNAIEPGAG